MTRPPERPPSLYEELLKYRNLMSAQVDAFDDLIVAAQRELAATQSRLARSEIPQRMGVNRAARYLGIGRTSLRKLIDSGQIAVFNGREDTERIILLKSDVDDYLRGLPQAGRERPARTRDTGEDRL